MFRICRKLAGKSVALGVAASHAIRPGRGGLGPRLLGRCLALLDHPKRLGFGGLCPPLGLGLGLTPALQPRHQPLEPPEGGIQLPLGRVEPCHTPTDSPFVAMPECHAAKAASTRLGRPKHNGARPT